MTTRVIRSKVGADGVLHLDLPLGIQEASQEVDVIVQSVRPTKLLTQEEWKAFIDRTAGTWQGEFERPEQGEYEVREPLS